MMTFLLQGAENAARTCINDHPRRMFSRHMGGWGEGNPGVCNATQQSRRVKAGIFCRASRHTFALRVIPHPTFSFQFNDLCADRGA
ncbi:hypothetical protein FUT88_00475 [Ralstonia sp. TCR112]|uniref:hypothetical protein n=1 Tax=Ralstonia sp. TCR112 TaxID=2601730 RepID=UPI0011BF02E6|nr:hypothetical protein [Ralstonia sp. TCR112]TXD63906.1 hypothetical protein FUT88_00475 [Ralstonia sp. TCR112]